MDVKSFLKTFVMNLAAGAGVATGAAVVVRIAFARPIADVKAVKSGRKSK